MFVMIALMFLSCRCALLRSVIMVSVRKNFELRVSNPRNLAHPSFIYIYIYIQSATGPAFSEKGGPSGELHVVVRP